MTSSALPPSKHLLSTLKICPLSSIKNTLSELLQRPAIIGKLAGRFQGTFSKAKGIGVGGFKDYIELAIAKMPKISLSLSFRDKRMLTSFYKLGKSDLLLNHFYSVFYSVWKVNMKARCIQVFNRVFPTDDSWRATAAVRFLKLLVHGQTQEATPTIPKIST